MAHKHFPSGCPVKVMQDPGQSSATWCQLWLLAWHAVTQQDKARGENGDALELSIFWNTF